MDPSPVHTTSPVEEDDEWDTEGFVIPCLGIEGVAPNNSESLEPEYHKPIALKVISPREDKTEDIYLGPHGAPPQPKHQELNPARRSQRFKQKLKGANQRASGTGHENKVGSLRELVGSSGRYNHHNVSKGNA